MTPLQRIERDVLEINGRITLRPTLELARQVGEKLLEAKTMVQHGEWLTWLRRVHLPPRSAQIYMAVAKSEVSAHSSMTIDQFLTRIRRAKRAALREARRTGPVEPRPAPQLDQTGPLNFLDLFSGIGGFGLAARIAGLAFTHHLYSETDDHRVRIYQKNFPEARALEMSGGSTPQGSGANIPATGSSPAGSPAKTSVTQGDGGGRRGTLRSLVGDVSNYWRPGTEIRSH